MKRIVQLLLSCSLVLSLCGGVSAEETEEEKQEILSEETAETEASTENVPNKECEWNVMIYLCGTDLESKEGLATQNLKAIADTLPSDEVNLLVQTGGAKEWDPAEKLGFDIANDRLQRWSYGDDGFVLMDSDVLVKRDITPLWNNRYAWIGSSHSNVLRKFGFNVWRVKPFICYINTPMLTKHGIRYFDPNRMWGLHNDGYDTGAVLYADCKKAGLPSLEVNIGEYIVHLRHASWCEKPADEWLEKYRNLWN